MILPSRGRSQFIKGPLPLKWFERASQCGPAAVTLGLLLFYKHGFGHKDLSVSAELTKRFSVSESTRRRTLRRMEAEGLIRTMIEGRKLRVQIILGPTSQATI